MYINFWYAAAETEKLGDEPIHLKMLGQEFVLFRDSSGIPHCLSNMCVHRGGSLGHGKVQGDTVECPYHGWRYGGDGICQKIPSLGPDAKIPERAKVDAYPTQEKYGLIFVFLGDIPEAERPPLMDVDRWGEEGWRCTMVSMEWPINYHRSIENGIDMAHNEFAHTTHVATAEGENFIIKDLDIEETEWTLETVMRSDGQVLANEKMRETSGKEEAGLTVTRVGQHGVSSLWTFIHPTPEMKIHQYIYETPIDDENTRIFLICARNFMLDPDFDEDVDERNIFVVEEDRVILTNLKPVRTPESRTKEIFTPADKPAIIYRDRLKKLQDQGWRIDSEAVKRDEGKVEYAIPCPDRRRKKNWLLDPVPMMEKQ